MTSQKDFRSKFLTVALVLFCVYISGYAQTDVSGTITGNTTWDIAGSPYILSGNLFINEGVSLIIEPGVEVRIENNRYIIVKGEIIAEGTETDSITFSPFGRGIHFDDLAIDYNPVGPAGSRFSYCNFSDPTLVEYDPILGGYGSTHFSNSQEYNTPSNNQTSILFENSMFEDIAFYLNGWGGKSIPEATYFRNNVVKGGTLNIDNAPNTIVEQNIFQGVAFDLTSADFLNNIFLDCEINRFYSQLHGYSYTSQYYEFQYNLILGRIEQFQGGESMRFRFNTYICPEGDNITGALAICSNNNILGGTGYKYVNTTNLAVNARNNYWETTDNAELADLVFDSEDDFSLGTVNYSSFLLSPNISAPISPPVLIERIQTENGLEISWQSNVESDLAGYKIHYGDFDGRSFANTLDVGNVTSYVLESAALGDVVLVTAYDDLADNDNDLFEGHESWFSEDLAPTVEIFGDETIRLKCKEDSVVLRATKSDQYRYEWLLNGSPIQDANRDTLVAKALGYGNESMYQVRVTSSTNLSATSNVITIEEVHMYVELPENTSAICGTSIQLEAVSNYFGDDNISYSWFPNTGLDNPEIADPLADVNSLTEKYVVTATLDGCTVADTIKIFVEPITIEAGQDKITTCGNSVQLNVTSNYEGAEALVYAWSPSTGLDDASIPNPTVSIDEDLTYSVSASLEGCNPAEDNVGIILQPYEPTPICLVTVDQLTGKNQIIWNKPSGEAIKSFNLHRETEVTGEYEIIGQINFDTPTEFTDLNSSPNQQSYRYKLSVIDSCNNESQMSDHHSTMHLTRNIGVGLVVNLIWSQYEGFPVTTYNIWKGSDATSLTKIGSVSGNNFTFTDESPNIFMTYYAVEVVSPNTCNTDLKKSIVNSSFSNVVSVDITNIENHDKVHDLLIHPNPFSSAAEVKIPVNELGDLVLEVIDYTGRIVFETNEVRGPSYMLYREEMVNGMYIVKLTGKSIYQVKLLVY